MSEDGSSVNQREHRTLIPAIVLTHPRTESPGDGRLAPVAASRSLMAPRSDLEYRPDIDGLRAIAVLSVVGYHAYPEWITGGFVGVDVFFVISGYLITSILSKAFAGNRFSFVGFYARRIKRIFPALAVVLTFCLVVGWFLLLPDEFRMLGKHTAAGAAFFANVVFWKETNNYFGTISELKTLLHLWSLGIEEQFYILWPLLLFLADKRRLNPLWLIFVLIGVSFCVNIVAVTDHSAGTFFLPFTRIWELLMGSALAYASPFGENWLGRLATRVSGAPGTGSRAWLKNVLGFLGALLLVTSIFAFDRDQAFPGWRALLPTAGALLLIAVGTEAWFNRTVLAFRGSVFLGLISYPLYLWHWPLLSLAKVHESGLVTLEHRTFLVFLSFLLACITYALIENPLRSIQRAVVPVGLIVSVAALAVAGGLIFSRDGFPQRYMARNVPRDSSRVVAELAGARQRMIRSPSCNLNRADQTFDQYRLGLHRCLAIDSTRKNYLVLGDSHAADLWAALSSAYEEHNFLQATGSSCIPVWVGGKKPPKRCQDFVHYIKYEFLPNTKVDGVILTARWDENSKADLSKAILADVEYFGSLGIRAAVFGPTFEFSANVQTLLQRRPHSGSIREWLDTHLNSSRISIDDNMEVFAKSHGIPYVSKISTLCLAASCPVFDDSTHILILDYSHWTVAGAREFGRVLREKQVLEKIFGPNMTPNEGKTVETP